MQKQMMIIAAAVLVVAVIGAGVFFFMSNSKKADDSMEAVDAVQQKGMESGSISELIGKGNVTCNIKYPDTGMEGTIYVAGDKVRGDFSTNTDGKLAENHMIRDDQFTYFWQGVEGMKMKNPEEVSPSGDAQGQQNQEFADFNKQVDMDCDTWSVDEGMFTPPTGVKFTELGDTSMMTEPETSNQPQDVMSACAQITDPQAKAACEAAAAGN